MSCVYKISFKDCDENYIGSSVYLNNRKKHHKSDCFNENSNSYNKKLYQFIRDNYEWEEVVFEIVEQHDEILDNLELRKREQHFININNPTLNSQKAYQTAEQLKEYNKENCKKYREENPDYYKEHNKKHYEENQEYHKERSKKHYEENQEYHKERSKKYREENREEYLKKNKKYYEENKAKLNKKYDCDCGGKYTHRHTKTHLKSKKHQDYLGALEKNII